MFINFMAVAAVALTGLVQQRPPFSEGTLTPLPIRPRRGFAVAGQSSSSAVPGWQKRRGRRRKAPLKHRNAKRLDAEFDLVIVPADGISMSGSESDVSDWSVGWLEPHHANFLTENELEDSFAVLVPCYGSPKPTPFEPQQQPPWAAVLANLSKHTNQENKRHLENWLACL